MRLLAANASGRVSDSAAVGAVASGAKAPDWPEAGVGVFVWVCA